MEDKLNYRWRLSLLLCGCGTAGIAHASSGDGSVANGTAIVGSEALDLLRTWGVVPPTVLRRQEPAYYVRAESDMTPPRCRTRGDLADRALCAAEDLRSLFGAAVDPADIAQLRLQSMNRGHSAEETFLAFRQEHAGVPVRPGHLVAFFRGNQLLLLSGEVSHVSDIPPPFPQLEQRRVVGPLPVTFSYQYIDGVRRKLVGAYVDENDDLRDEHIIDADGSLLEWRRTASSSGNRTVTMWVDGYANGYMRHAPSSVQQTVSAYCQDGTGTCGVSGSGTCRFFPHRAPNTVGYPQRTIVQYKEPPVEETVWTDADCGSTFPWSSIDLGYYEFFGTSFFGQIHRAADLKTHWSQYLYYAESTQRRLEIKAQTNSPGPPAIYVRDQGNGIARISAWQSIWPLTEASQARDLSTTVHEYGHHVHDRYGYHGKPSTAEGWADQYALRFAKYMGDFGGWSIGYSSAIGMTLEYRHGEASFTTEYLVYDPNSASELDMYRDGPRCFGEPEEPGEPPGPEYEPHQCGQVLAVVYWELAWNKCKLRYMDCTQNQDIIQSGPYLSTPWALANSAFAYAISVMPSTGRPADFMQLVYDRYAQFQSIYGYLSSTDLARVKSVMAHHCLGPGDFCGGAYHKLPGSPLPNRYTKKASTYAEAELNAPAGSVWAGPYNASAGQEVAMTEPTVGGNPSRFVRFTIAVPGGTYKVRPLATKSPTGSVSVIWRVNGGAWQTTAVSLPSSYNWVTLGERVFPYGTSTIDVRVAYNQTFWLDGLNLELQ